jgi:hypothetical protein
MASTLSYSDYSSNNKNEEFSSKKRKNRTIKKKSKKVEQFLNTMGSIDNEEEDLADFNTEFKQFPPNPELTKQPYEKQEDFNQTDVSVSPEGFTKLDSNKTNDMNYQNYFNTYIPYYNKATNNSNLHGSKDELMRKLNYMIHLLEENKDEKTQNVTEELVLYMFLGVFTIFVVDSFARAGKYTR